MNKKESKQVKGARGSLMLEGRGADEKYALISFVSKGRGEQLVSISRSFQALTNTILLGRGTARSEILDYLGLELDEKEIVVSYVHTNRAQATLQALHTKLEMDRPGHGISFLIPILDSKGLKAVFRFAQQVDEDNPEIEQTIDPYSIPDDGIIFGQHDLIIAILPSDTAEEAMDRAREVGAPGGTIIHGRGAVNDRGDFFGAMADPDRDLLLMLIRKNKTSEILKALCKNLNSEDFSGMLAFALPVSAVAGLAHRLRVTEDGSVVEQTYHS